MRAYLSLALICGVLCCPTPAHAQIDPSIHWRIENPFRLFRNASDFERLRIPADTSIQDWFSGIAHRIDDDFLPYRRTFWDPPSGRNTSGQYAPGYVFPRSHRIVLGWAGADAAGRCDWQVGERWQRDVSCSKVTADIPFDHTASAGPERRSAPIKVSVVSRSSPRKASTTIEVVDTLVLALGDSYSAGEGSPDRPARLSFTDSTRIPSPYKDCEEGVPCVWFPGLRGGDAAQWWDEECDRSLLSWPALAALKLASFYADKAQEKGVSAARQYAVTFVSYACSGAEFFDGVFMPQREPPGPSKVSPSAELGAPQRKPVQASQLQAAGADLCDFPGGAKKSGLGSRRVEYFECDRPRKADMVLMSVGGNDAGFAKVIMNGLLPRPSQGNSKAGAVSLAILHKMLDTVSVEEAEQRRLRMLPNYPTLKQYLTPFMADDAPLFFMAYPNPLLRPEHLRASEGDACGLEMRAGMEAARMIGYPIVKSWWHFWFDHDEAQRTMDRMVRPLQDDIGKTVAQNKNWHYVTGHLNAFREHGLCADAVKAETDPDYVQPRDARIENVERYRLPRQEWLQGRPQRLPSFDWEPYDTSRQRWIRTPNDALLTQTAGSLRESLHGAFHPTGAGYAAMADAAFAEMVVHANTRMGTHRPEVEKGSP